MINSQELNKKTELSLSKVSEPLSEDSLQRQRALFAVVIAIIIACGSLVLALQWLGIGVPFMAAYMTLASLFYMVTIIFYRKGSYRAATIYLTTLALLSMSNVNLLILGKDAAGHHFLLCNAALTPLVMHSKDRVWGYIIVFLALAGFTAVEFFDWSRPFEITTNIAQTNQYRNQVIASTVVFLVAMIIYFDQRLRKAQGEARQLHLLSENLLHNILPETIANRLKKGEGPIAERHCNVTILFADLVGFTALCNDQPPERVVNILNLLFTELDSLAERFNLEKIKTIGDSYMVVGGLLTKKTDHAEAIALMAIEMRQVVNNIALKLGHPLDIRIGIHTGEVVAGVIGRKKFAYDLWGDAVNIAARMESHGIPGEIQLTSSTNSLLGRKFTSEPRGIIDIKGKGSMKTWLLKGTRIKNIN